MNMISKIVFAASMLTGLTAYAMASLPSSGQVDPRDPLTAKLAAVVIDASDNYLHFCGTSTRPIPAARNNNSTFENIAVNACKTIKSDKKGKCGSICQQECRWDDIYFIENSPSSTPKMICKSESNYCNNHKFSDCNLVTSICLTMQKTFQAQCLQKG